MGSFGMRHHLASGSIPICTNGNTRKRSQLVNLEIIWITLPPVEVAKITKVKRLVDGSTTARDALTTLALVQMPLSSAFPTAEPTLKVVVGGVAGQSKQLVPAITGSSASILERRAPIWIEMSFTLRSISARTLIQSVTLPRLLSSNGLLVSSIGLTPSRATLKVGGPTRRN